MSKIKTVKDKVLFQDYCETIERYGIDTLIYFEDIAFLYEADFSLSETLTIIRGGRQ